MQIHLARVIWKDVFGAGDGHAFDHQRHVSSAKFGKRRLLKQKAEMVEMKEFVSDRNANLFVRIARQDLSSETQSVRNPRVVLDRSNSSVEPEHTQADVDVALLLIFTKASLKENHGFQKRAVSKIRNAPVELANRFYLAGNANEELVQHRAAYLGIGCSINGAIEVVGMLVLYQSLPQPSLNIGRLVFCLVPENQKIVDDIYDSMIIKQSFEYRLV